MDNNIVKIAFIGVGSISGIYLENLTNLYKEIEIIGVCDLVKERAVNAAEKYNIKKVYDDMHEAFADKEVDIILNLTRPYEHFDVSSAAIKAGKNVYSEKPLGASFEEGEQLVKLANEHKVFLGGAPDTFLGAGIQTCRKLIDDGFIGDIVGASAFMACHGHETWHPDPEFYYKFGGGPMLDMGPYYITALVNLMGGVQSVSGMNNKSFKKRLITSKEKCGDIIDVDVATNITGNLLFESGAIGTIYTTFDVFKANLPIIEIYGSLGTLSVPDPNGFEGPVKIYRPEKGDFLEFPLCFDYCENSRGLGLADMAKAIKTNRNFRANNNLTLHVLEVMTSIIKSGEEKKQLDIKSKFVREIPMKKAELKGILD